MRKIRHEANKADIEILKAYTRFGLIESMNVVSCEKSD